MAQKKVRRVAQAARMPSTKAAKSKSMGRGLTAHKLPSGKSMELGAKLGGGKARRAGGAVKAPKVRKGSAKIPKAPPAAFAGAKKGKKAPPFLGAAPPLE